MSDNQWTWQARLLAALQALWPVDRPLTLALAEPDHPVWSMYPQAEAACNIRPDGSITIYLRAVAMDNEYWREVLIHEYTHAAMADVLPTDPDDAARQRVEDMTVRIGGLLDYAIRTGATRRDRSNRVTTTNEMDDWEHDESVCPRCGHEPTRWRRCHAMMQGREWEALCDYMAANAPEPEPSYDYFEPKDEDWDKYEGPHWDTPGGY